MESKEKRSISLRAWAFRRLWCVVALPWLLVGVGIGIKNAVYFEDFVSGELKGDLRATLVNGSSFGADQDQALRGILLSTFPETGTTTRQVAESLIMSTANRPGGRWSALAVGCWQSTGAAYFVYQQSEGKLWGLAEALRSGNSANFFDYTGGAGWSAPQPSVIPDAWFQRTDLYEEALRGLRRQEDNGAANDSYVYKQHWSVVYRYIEKLPISGKPGFMNLGVTRDQAGGVRAAFIEVDAESDFAYPRSNVWPASGYGNPAEFYTKGIAFRVMNDGELRPFCDSQRKKFADFFRQHVPVTHLETAGIEVTTRRMCIRGNVEGIPNWLAFEVFFKRPGEGVLIGAYAPEQSLIIRASIWPLACMAVFLLTWLSLWWGTWRALGSVARIHTDAKRAVEGLTFARGPYYWPPTRVAELRELQQAVEATARYINERLPMIQDSSVATPQAPVQRGLPPEPVVASHDAPTIILTEPSAIEVRATVVPQAANEDGDAPRTLIAPPVAFMQAMDSLRKQLADAKRALEAVQSESARRASEKESEITLAERLLGAFRGVNAESDVAEVLKLALGAVEARSYDAHEAFKLLRDESGPEGGQLPREIARGAHPLFFLALERARVLWVDDAAEDPRCARLLGDGGVAGAMSVVALMLGNGERVWIGARPQGKSGWRAAEQVFAESLLRTQAPMGTSAAAPEADAAPGHAAYPPQSAHAAWAQPNLPPQQDQVVFREMVDSAAAGLFTLSRTGKFQYANAAAERLFGAGGATLLGRALVEFAAPGDDGAVNSAIQRVLDGAAVEERDAHFRAGKGGTRLLRLFLSPLQDESGEPIGIAGSALDVSELRARELVLERQEGLYRGIVEGAPQLLWSVDAIGCITFVNSVSSLIYGYAPGELIGRPITVLCDEEQARMDVERLALLLGGKTCTGYRTVHRHKDGTPVPLVVVASRQLDAAGRVLNAVGVAIAMDGEAE